MQQANYQVIFFRSANQRPVDDFILEQDGVTHAKINKCIRLLFAYGSHAGWPFVKKIEKGLFELRIRGSVEIRFIFVVLGSSVLILHGFKKKTQKLPLKELRLAKKRLTGVSHI